MTPPGNSGANPINNPRNFSMAKKKSHLFGLGLDGDGHKRITEADKFSVIGGTEDTHDRMTETLMKTFEDLKRKGKELEETSPRELSDIIRKNIPPR